MPPTWPTTLYTIGFTKSSAAHFFGRLQQAGVRRLIDVRLNNTSTLAGFTKRDDLEYFLALHDIAYHHEPLLAPEPEMLKAIQSKAITWDDYLSMYMALMEARRVAEVLDPRSLHWSDRAAMQRGHPRALSSATDCGALAGALGRPGDHPPVTARGAHR